MTTTQQYAIRRYGSTEILCIETIDVMPRSDQNPIDDTCFRAVRRTERRLDLDGECWYERVPAVPGGER